MIIILVLVTACAPAAQEVVILTVSDKGYTRTALEALGTKSVDYTDKDGEIKTYDGVHLAALLDDAGISGSSLTFTASDDYQAELSTDEAMVCKNCIVAFDDDSLRLVMPDFSGKLQVKDLISINAQ